MDFGGIGTAIGALFGTIKPFVDEHFSQKYENEHKDRIEEFNDILEAEDSDDRAGRLDRFIQRLCDSAGNPGGDVQGRRINIPLSYFQSLVTIASGKIKDDELLARLQFKQT